MQLVTDPKYRRYWDEAAGVPYLLSIDNIFISYDDKASTGEKLNYLKEKGLGGAMFWELSGDIRNADDPESLVRYVYKGLNSSVLILGNTAGSSEEYSLSSGEIWTFDAIVGNAGTGKFIHTGDSIHNVTYELVLGRETGGRGEYILADNGGLFSTITFVGLNGEGVFEQTGGGHLAYNSLILAANPGSTGAYNLSGGFLDPGYTLRVGADGAFNQSGGVVNVLLCNTAIDVSGAYNLSGGILYPGYILRVGAGGAFNQIGGLVVGRENLTAIDISGFYNLAGGSLYPGDTLEVRAGGAFNQIGGVVNGLLNNTAINLSGAYNLLDGALSANTIYLNRGGGFNYIGGSLDYQTLFFRGGDFAGDLTNRGYLLGSGTIYGNLVNSGIVNPGSSPGTLNIVGSFTQTAAGAYIVEVDSPASYDRIAVSGAPGTATLAGTVAPTLLGGYQPRGNQVFPGVITTTGGVHGTFSTILNQQISPTLFWQARYNPASVDLWVQRDYTNSSLGLNSNQQAVGTMLNGVAGAASGDQDTVLNAIDYLPGSASVREAFKQVSPEKAGALTSLGFVAANFQMRNLATRTTNLRFVQGEGSGGSPLRGGALNFNYSKTNGLMLAYNGAVTSDLFSARKEFQPPDSRWGIYLDGGATFGARNSSINQTGYNLTLGGFTLGADYRVQDYLLVGLATGYSNTQAGFKGSGGSVSTNSIPFNAYAAYFPGPLYVYGSIGYALNLYDLNRGIGFNGISRSASSSSTGHQFNLYGETGYDFRLPRLILTPSATLAFSGLWVGGLKESGAGALNLKVAPQSATSVQTGIGARATVPLKVGAAKVVPQGYAFFQHEFADGSRNLSASLSQGSTSVNYQTDAPSRNFALLGASVTAGLKKNLYAQLNYSAEVGRAGSTSHTFNAGLRWEF